MTDRQQILDETLAARAKALDLLKALNQSRDAIEPGSKDLFKRVTGQSSIENSIAATRRTIEAYDKVIAQIQAGGEVPMVTIAGSPRQGARS